MVCVPCLVIPALLWVFYRFIQPLLEKYFGFGAIPALSDVDKSSDIYLQIQKGAQQAPVVLYEKCPKQKEVDNLLDQLGVLYKVQYIDNSTNPSETKAMLEKISRKREMPFIFIGGNCVGSEVDLSTLMTEKKLMPLLQEAGATIKKSD